MDILKDFSIDKKKLLEELKIKYLEIKLNIYKDS